MRSQQSELQAERCLSIKPPGHNTASEDLSASIADRQARAFV